MSDLKQVKVDNWGIYFLQRLKHFFNRTDYCDLTLQFQDNAQLKVHRLVLSACTEYFEVLERTCEMYEDCLVMPDDLQADVVVPIINFMYTGQLEFKPDLLEKLHLTSLIMNMPVLTKLLDAQKEQLMMKKLNITPNYGYGKQYPKPYKKPKKSLESGHVASTSRAMGTKRPYNKSFDSTSVSIDKKLYQPPNKTDKNVSNNGFTTVYRSTSPSPLEEAASARKVVLGEPRPTRYELPEELETDNIYSNSFTSISYTSAPLMVHPETTKKYSKKSDKLAVFTHNSSSRKMRSKATVDIVNCKQSKRDSWDFESEADDNDVFRTTIQNTAEVASDPSQLFDQILDDGPKLTIETKPGKQAGNIDHAKIISEVLKKYPHLVKNNKNIKLKILDSSTKTKKTLLMPNLTKTKNKSMDFTYESEVLDSKEAASLIAKGAENIRGPWICLICGTPGRAIHFQSYYKFRRHLVEVHNEKPVSNICEYCGLKSNKRNYLLHHLYTKHGVPPPPQYRFPKCKLCSYIALTEGLMNKHKAAHSESSSFRCNVCSKIFDDSNTLLLHIQATGHKYTAEKKSNIQCIYCMKLFTRESNLYTHLKTHHKLEAKDDGIIEDSDEDIPKGRKSNLIKTEPKSEYGYDSESEPVNIQYQIEQRPDGQVRLVSKRTNLLTTVKQKILNPGFGNTIRKSPQKANAILNASSSFMETSPECLGEEDNHDEIIVIGETEYIMKNNQLIPRKEFHPTEEYIVSEMIEQSSNLQNPMITSDLEYTNISSIVQSTDGNMNSETKMLIKKSDNVDQPIEIVVSNAEEYKALMSSNHSIIFDDSDASKTLTVLTAPDGSTAIDLGNAPPNDDMMIPLDFPLAVSEAVPSDSSNIVVVYSHPVEDQNKSYQLQTQFVQSSSSYTQNYETITSSTPIITTATIDNQNEPAWQTTITTATEMQATSDSNIEEMAAIPESNEQADNEIHMNDLPEVSLAIQNQETLAGDTELEDVHEKTNINEEVIGNETVQDAQDNSTANQQINKEFDTQVIVEIESAATIDKNEEHETINATETNEDASLVIIQEQKDYQAETEEVVQSGIEPVIEAQEVVEEQSQSSEETENLPVVENAEEISQTSLTTFTNSVENGKISDVVPKIPVANLAMEWSEDEDPESEEAVSELASVQNAENDAEKNFDNVSTEVEESIENIQQEMEKQISEQENVVNETEFENGEPLDVVLENTKQDGSNCSENKDVDPKEKLSSLLNDWEENDSQEGSANENDDSSTNQNNKVEENSSEVVENATLDPESNVKSLVKDWDDEVEENKD